MEKNKKDELVTVADIECALNSMFPEALQEEWDNSGMILGFYDNHVKKILTCLELDERVADEAAEAGADMIITHHPLIFGSIANISDRDCKGRLLMRLVNRCISVYSCHTPFDKIKGGNNDILADMLGLVSIKNLSGKDVSSSAKMIENKTEADLGRIGKFKGKKSFANVIELVSNRLAISLRELRAVGSLDTEIKTVGICTGAGADMMQLAKKSGCDLFITGDVKYHEAKTAEELGMCLIDAGHYHTEKIFGEKMKEKLSDKLSCDIEIITTNIDLNPFVVL